MNMKYPNPPREQISWLPLVGMIGAVLSMFMAIRQNKAVGKETYDIIICKQCLFCIIDENYIKHIKHTRIEPISPPPPPIVSVMAS